MLEQPRFVLELGEIEIGHDRLEFDGRDTCGEERGHDRAGRRPGDLVELVGIGPVWRWSCGEPRCTHVEAGFGPGDAVASDGLGWLARPLAGVMFAPNRARQ